MDNYSKWLANFIYEQADMNELRTSIKKIFNGSNLDRTKALCDLVRSWSKYKCNYLLPELGYFTQGLPINIVEYLIFIIDYVEINDRKQKKRHIKIYQKLTDLLWGDRIFINSIKVKQIDMRRITNISHINQYLHIEFQRIVYVMETDHCPRFLAWNHIQKELFRPNDLSFIWFVRPCSQLNIKYQRNFQIKSQIFSLLIELQNIVLQYDELEFEQYVLYLFC